MRLHVLTRVLRYCSSLEQPLSFEYMELNFKPAYSDVVKFRILVFWDVMLHHSARVPDISEELAGFILGSS